MSGGTNAGMLMQMVGVAAQTGAAYAQSTATRNAYNVQEKVARNNAQIAEWQAQDAAARGARNEQMSRLKTAQLAGTQRARLAANGVSLTEGSALNILDDTAYMGELDAQAIRDNTSKEVWGQRTQAQNLRDEAALFGYRADAESPLLATASTFLTAGGRVADKWFPPKTKKTGT